MASTEAAKRRAGGHRRDGLPGELRPRKGAIDGLTSCSGGQRSISKLISRSEMLDGRSPNTYNVHMNGLGFEWDEAKNHANVRKHGVSFEEAQTVFLDEKAIRYFDPDHSEDEDRFIMLGMSWKLRVVIVCHCFRAEDSVIRIISARKANTNEAAAYWS